MRNFIVLDIYEKFHSLINILEKSVLTHPYVEEYLHGFSIGTSCPGNILINNIF